MQIRRTLLTLHFPKNPWEYFHKRGGVKKPDTIMAWNSLVYYYYSQDKKFFFFIFRCFSESFLKWKEH